MSNESNYDRRQFITTTAKAGIASGFLINSFSSFAKNGNRIYHRSPDPVTYKQQPLPYTYNALEPYIGAATMELHHTKHAAAYAKNLAEAVIAEGVNIEKTSLEDLLANISSYSTKMRNNAGGHYNHELFWKLMSAPTKAQVPTGNLLNAINKNFGSFDAFKAQFSEAAKNRFGSGWAWLIYTHEKKLLVASTSNQDNPLMNIAEVKGFPLLGLDVWEHAYYLKYHNLRADYINAWWNILNWQYVDSRWDSIA
ncbi:MAG: superoxide dismutase [Bacteroidetes bacterium]|nr:superoxide dismutase [Bacteroidota bacterium]